jgi:outer membrane cobalamin receptor
MTEIEQVIEQLQASGRWGLAALFKESYASLITTIESQKEEIEGYKAITELAVKCLELVANGNIYFPNWADTVDILIDVRKVAKDTLSEIERLQNEGS